VLKYYSRMTYEVLSEHAIMLTHVSYRHKNFASFVDSTKGYRGMTGIVFATGKPSSSCSAVGDGKFLLMLLSLSWGSV
jgi:hypothetical protein